MALLDHKKDIIDTAVSKLLDASEISSFYREARELQRKLQYYKDQENIEDIQNSITKKIQAAVSLLQDAFRNLDRSIPDPDQRLEWLSQNKRVFGRRKIGSGKWLTDTKNHVTMLPFLISGGEFFTALHQMEQNNEIWFSKDHSKICFEDGDENCIPKEGEEDDHDF